MKQRKNPQKILLILTLLFTSQIGFSMVKMPPPSLEKRVSAAKTVFVGKVVNKVIHGDWVHAELIVETSLKNAKCKERIKVIWRAKSGGRLMIGVPPGFDVAEGTRAIAILKDKHEGRYWLRGDKFENLKNLDKVKALIKAQIEKKIG